MKIYPLRHSESFYTSLFNWLLKRQKHLKEVLINCNTFYLICHTIDCMHVNMLIRLRVIKIDNKF